MLEGMEFVAILVLKALIISSLTTLRRFQVMDSLEYIRLSILGVAVL